MFFFVVVVCFHGVVVLSFASPNIFHCITTTNETNMQQPISFVLLVIEFLSDCTTDLKWILLFSYGEVQV